MACPIATAFRARWGKFFTSQPVFLSLCVVQVLGVAGLAVAATIEIEAVLLTPLVLAFLGLLLAWAEWQRKRGLVSVLFGLAFPALVVVGVLLIRRLELNRWKQAEEMIRALVLSSGLIVVPLGLFVLSKATGSHNRLPQARSQFKTRTALIVLSLLAVSFACSRAITDIAPGALPITESVLFTLTLFAIGGVCIHRIVLDGEGLDAKPIRHVFVATTVLLAVYLGVLRGFFHSTNEGTLSFVSPEALRVLRLKDGVQVDYYDIRAGLRPGGAVGGWHVPAGQWEFAIDGNRDDVQLLPTRVDVRRGVRQDIYVVSAKRSGSRPVSGD